MADSHAHDGASLLTRPELREFVAAAVTQELVRTCVTAESVQAGLEHRRRRQQSRRVLILSATLAVAASLIAAVGVSWWDIDDGDTDPGIADLDPAVRLRSTGSAEIRGPWTLALGPGTHELELEPNAAGPLTIELPDRTLELVEGRATIEVVEHDAVVRLYVGVAAWIDADGTRTIIDVQPLSPSAEALASTLLDDPESASALAREAERQLAAGAREQAIVSLRRLIELHPQASQSHAALLDLGRLLAESGREHEARCAFALVLERWPASPVAPEVEDRLARLPSSANGCDGLDPR